MGWRYKAGLVLIGSVVLIWVTSAEVTQVRCMRSSFISQQVDCRDHLEMKRNSKE
jgi:hypothetical protein